MVCIKIQSRVLEAEIITGKFKGQRCFIPRINLDPSDSGLPFDFRRRQFPVKLSFSMTINKSQGQTLKKKTQYIYLTQYLPMGNYT